MKTECPYCFNECDVPSDSIQTIEGQIPYEFQIAPAKCEDCGAYQEIIKSFTQTEIIWVLPGLEP